MSSRERAILICAAWLVAGSAQAGAIEELLLDGFESPFVETTGFRITELVLRDPHPFAEFSILCLDATTEFNSSISDSLNLDQNADDVLDLSFVLGMRPLDQTGAPAALDLYLADCTFPAAGTSCAPVADNPLLATTTYHAAADPVCLDVIPGTTGSYMPPIGLATTPCFSSQPVDTALPILGTQLPLLGFLLGATFQNDPATQMVNGLMFGFLTEADAEMAFLPEGIPLVGGQPLSALLPGGEGNCSSNDDRDTYDTQLGWWLYFNFEAQAVPFTP